MRKLLLTLGVVCSALAVAASTFTTHYSLEKPIDGSTTWGPAIRDNYDIIDTQLYVDATTIANHIADTTAAHAATAISTTVGTLCSSAINVQTFLICLDTNFNSVVSGGAVTITGTQTITGAKTFSALTTFSGGVDITTLGTGVVHSDSSGNLSSSLLVNADVSSSAAIAYSKLNLTGSIVNADVNATAGIVDTKLSTISTAGKVSNSATTATSANTASAIVARDASGNFTAGTITATLSGTATNATNGTTVAVSNNASYFPAMFASSSNGNQPFNLDTTFTYNPSTDTLTATTFSGNSTTSTTATNATNMATVAVSNNATYFPILAASSTNSNQAHNLDTTFTYNPSTDTLTATTFAGNASTATTATTATNTTNTAITDDNATNATMYPTWVTTTTGNLPQKISSTKLRFNPSTSTLTATFFAGTATNATNIKTTLDNSTNSFLPILFTDSGSTTTQGVKVDDGPTKFGYNPSSGTLLLGGNVIGGNISGTNTGDISIGNFGSSPNSTGLTLGSGQILNLEAADISDPGAVSTTTQTFAGAKTFNDGLIAASTLTMPLQPASMVPVFDGSSNLISSSITDTELGFISGVTSNIQTQLNGKLDNAGNVVVNSLLAQMAAGTVKGRAIGAGTGDPTDLTLASAATASAVMARDANANTRVNALISNYQTIATAAGTTTLTVGSPFNTYFTGSTTQTVTLPVTSTLVLGQQFQITNNSSGTVTINSSGSNLVQSLAGGNAGIYTVILTSGTTAASWSSVVPTGGAGTGTVTSVAQTVPNYLSIAGSPVTTSGTLAITMNSAPVSKTTTYTVVSTDSAFVASGASFTFTLPAATNKMRIKFIHNDSDLSRQYTIARAGSDTIGRLAATSTIIATQGEILELESDGTSVWDIISRTYPQKLVSYTPTFTGFGTASAIEIQWSRRGPNLFLTGKFTSGTSTATEARMSLPTGLTSTAFSSIKVAGFGIRAVADAAMYPSLIEPSVTYITFGDQSLTTSGLTKLNGNVFLASGDKYSFNADIPILGWE